MYIDNKQVSSIYNPFPWQINAWKDKSSVLLLTGAAGGGKSRIAAEKVHAYNLHYPGVTTIIGRKDKTAASKSVVPFMLYTVMGKTDWGEYKKSDGMFQYSNGSQMWIVGMRDEGQRESLRSIGKDGNVDLAWFEEANKLTAEDDMEITGRMRGTRGGYRQKIYTTNPDHPNHWIKTKLIDGKGASTYYSRPEENPFNPPDYIEQLQTLTGVYYQRMWLGNWVQAEGIIYTNYNADKHLLHEDVPTPYSGEYYISIDFGYTHAFSCSLWRVTRNKINSDLSKIYQVKQIYRTRRLVEDHAEDIRKMLLSVEIPIPTIKKWICDHDAEGRATLERKLNIKTIPAYKAVKAGIEAVDMRFKSNTLFLNANAVDNPDEEQVRNYLPTCTSDEITGYSWSDKKQDEPIKENDHGCDEMRYLVAHVDNISHKSEELTTKARVQNYAR